MGRSIDRRELAVEALSAVEASDLAGALAPVIAEVTA